MATFIRSASTGLVTTFGKCTAIAPPGLKLYIPYVQSVYHVSNKTQQKDFRFRIFTQDKVYANISLAIQYRIDAKDTEKAFFSLDDPISQMSAYVENSVRSHAPKSTLTNLYESFDSIGTIVNKELKDKMASHGFTIENILMTGLEPDPEVTKAINHVSASERFREAAVNEAEANYIKRIKEAEADCKRKILQGEGVAGQRKAILDGYNENINNMVKITGMEPMEIMQFILESQALDTKEQIGRSPNTKVLFMDSSPRKQNESSPNTSANTTASVSSITQSILLALEASKTKGMKSNTYPDEPLNTGPGSGPRSLVPARLDDVYSNSSH